jgi:hypothetical protein
LIRRSGQSPVLLDGSLVVEDLDVGILDAVPARRDVQGIVGALTGA